MIKGNQKIVIEIGIRLFAQSLVDSVLHIKAKVLCWKLPAESRCAALSH